MTIAIPQRSFSSGEITPGLYARVDQALYSIGLRTCRNMYIQKQGGAVNRPGTEYIVPVKDSSKTVRLIPFIFNNDQTYVLEFGDQYIRFIKDGVQLTSGGVPYEISTPYLEADLPLLNFAQSADVITIVHRSYAPRELSRLADTSWTLATISDGPGSTPPSIYGISTDAAEDLAYSSNKYRLTLVLANGEETLPTDYTRDVLQNVSTTQKTLLYIRSNGRDVGEYSHYVVYRYIVNTKPGFIYADGEIGTPLLGFAFYDYGQTASIRTPPQDPGLFSSAGDYPGAVCYHQNRLIFGGTDNNPEGIWASRIGSYKNNFTRFPTTDDDAISFSLVGRQVSNIKHLVEMSKLMVFSSSNEWIIKGNDAGSITPTTINAEPQTESGCTDLRPIIVNGSILFVQSRGSIVRDFLFDVELDMYRGNDMTILSNHLFKNKTIVDWTYQQIPNSIAWVVMSDGGLLGLTYIREESMLAWHRHDFENGLVENVISVPEGTEDALYLVIKRTINGSTVRHIERMGSRAFDDIEDLPLMDSFKSYDGTNTTASLTMTLSLDAGTTWGHEEKLTLTSSASYFVAGDVGNEIHITGSDGEIIRLLITDYTSGTVVSVKPHKTVPTSIRSTALSTWGKAVKTYSGLDHLVGEDVSVFGDGFVVASPNNPKYDTVTVSAGGSVVLDRAYVVVHIGLPITSDLETLDMDTIQGPSMTGKRQSATELNLFIEETRGVFVGPEPPSGSDALENLDELKIRNDEPLETPTELTTDWVKVRMKSKWSKGGRIFIRQVDPLPLKVLAIAPGGYIPTGTN